MPCVIYPDTSTSFLQESGEHHCDELEDSQDLGGSGESCLSTETSATSQTATSSETGSGSATFTGSSLTEEDEDVTEALPPEVQWELDQAEAALQQPQTLEDLLSSARHFLEETAVSAAERDYWTRQLLATPQGIGWILPEGSSQVLSGDEEASRWREEAPSPPVDADVPTPPDGDEGTWALEELASGLQTPLEAGVASRRSTLRPESLGMSIQSLPLASSAVWGAEGLEVVDAPGGRTTPCYGTPSEQRLQRLRRAQPPPPLATPSAAKSGSLCLPSPAAGGGTPTQAPPTPAVGAATLTPGALRATAISKEDELLGLVQELVEAERRRTAGAGEVTANISPFASAPPADLQQQLQQLQMLQQLQHLQQLQQLQQLLQLQRQQEEEERGPAEREQEELQRLQPPHPQQPQPQQPQPQPQQQVVLPRWSRRSMWRGAHQEAPGEETAKRQVADACVATSPLASGPSGPLEPLPDEIAEPTAEEEEEEEKEDDEKKEEGEEKDEVEEVPEKTLQDFGCQTHDEVQDIPVVEVVTFEGTAASAPDVSDEAALAGEDAWLDLRDGSISRPSFWLSRMPARAVHQYLHSTDTYVPLGMVRPPSIADPSAAAEVEGDEALDSSKVGEAPVDDEEAGMVSPVLPNRSTAALEEEGFGEMTPKAAPAGEAEQVLHRIDGLMSQVERMRHSLVSMRDELDSADGLPDESYPQPPSSQSPRPKPKARSSTSASRRERPLTPIRIEPPLRLRHRLPASLVHVEGLSTSTPKKKEPPRHHSWSAPKVAALAPQRAGRAQAGRVAGRRQAVQRGQARYRTPLRRGLTPEGGPVDSATIRGSSAEKPAAGSSACCMVAGVAAVRPVAAAGVQTRKPVAQRASAVVSPGVRPMRLALAPAGQPPAVALDLPSRQRRNLGD